MCLPAQLPQKCCNYLKGVLADGFKKEVYMKKASIILQFFCSVLWGVIGTLRARDGDKVPAVVAYVNCALSFAIGVLRILTPDEAEKISVED